MHETKTEVALHKRNEHMYDKKEVMCSLWAAYAVEDQYGDACDSRT